MREEKGRGYINPRGREKEKEMEEQREMYIGGEGHADRRREAAGEGKLRESTTERD